jgi:hypothetical protein
MKTLTFSFNIFVDDDFIEAVRKYADRETTEDVQDEDIVCYVEDNLQPARSNSDCFQVEGGDTDGWFVNGFQGYD